jgi:5-methylcytosine-specific restriction endonuclease McrA
VSTGQAPPCPRCRHRHLPGLRCWAGRYVYDVLARVLAHYGQACCHCARPGSNSVEHVVPRSVGGTDDLANLRPAHLACNVRRGVGAMAGYGQRTITETRSSRW